MLLNSSPIRLIRVYSKKISSGSDQDHNTAGRDSGSLVLSPNGKGQPEIALTDLVPYGGPTSSSLVEMQDGIGTVKFLRGKRFFISGATGFLAKVLIEKILRTMPDIINAELFTCLREAYGKSYQSFMLSKLVPVVGNVCESNIGLEEDLANEVDVIINSVANTSFDERHGLFLQGKNTKRYGRQDTYVFTKAMGEMVVDNTRGDIPILVIRPSVTESTWKEPFPGWMEGNRMMDPIVLYYGKGQLTGFLVNSNGVLDVVPANMVVNAIWNGVEIRYQCLPNCFIRCQSTCFPRPGYNSSPYMDSNGRPIHVPSMKLFSCMEDLSVHLWRVAIQRSQLAEKASSDRKLPQKHENIFRNKQSTWPIYTSHTLSMVEGKHMFVNSNTQKLRERMRMGNLDLTWEVLAGEIIMP
ncbi:hypothetical protein DKX38_010191 [Salix brachista]|uniref:Fatty acyl-CoA reductase n=1 Tax=Salix brachista TaxID=2182728 RepID=A0A5N5MCH7_9ROSI|nr:hypothetical protein DKX38_010191 [Salix brachista]